MVMYLPSKGIRDGKIASANLMDAHHHSRADHLLQMHSLCERADFLIVCTDTEIHIHSDSNVTAV